MFYVDYEFACELIKLSKDFLFSKEDEETFKNYFKIEGGIMKAESVEDLRNILILKDII